jgi:hypothetical protein
MTLVRFKFGGTWHSAAEAADDGDITHTRCGFILADHMQVDNGDVPTCALCLATFDDPAATRPTTQ